MKYLITGLILFILPFEHTIAQNVKPVDVEYQHEWVLFTQGSDESLHSIKVKIWGTLRDSTYFKKGFKQLDDDKELEYYIISRNRGTFPYYKLQIIDFHLKGISTWSYDSYGRVKFEGKIVKLGNTNQIYNQVRINPEYSEYYFTQSGLMKIE